MATEFVPKAEQVDARSWARGFFGWYNHEHHHVALGLLTPEVVHYGEAPAVLAEGQRVLATADAAHPERFVRGPVTPRTLVHKQRVDCRIARNHPNWHACRTLREASVLRHTIEVNVATPRGGTNENIGLH